MSKTGRGTIVAMRSTTRASLRNWGGSPPSASNRGCATRSPGTWRTRNGWSRSQVARIATGSSSNIPIFELASVPDPARHLEPDDAHVRVDVREHEQRAERLQDRRVLPEKDGGDDGEERESPEIRRG